MLFQFLKQESHCSAQASSNLLQPSCLSTISTGITGMHHHTQLPGVLLIKFGSEIGKTLTSAWLNSALCDLLESQFQTASQEGRPGARNLSHRGHELVPCRPFSWPRPLWANPGRKPRAESQPQLERWMLEQEGHFMLCTMPHCALLQGGQCYHCKGKLRTKSPL